MDVITYLSYKCAIQPENVHLVLVSSSTHDTRQTAGRRVVLLEHADVNRVYYVSLNYDAHFFVTRNKRKITTRLPPADSVDSRVNIGCGSPLVVVRVFDVRNLNAERALSTKRIARCLVPGAVSKNALSPKSSCEKGIVVLRNIFDTENKYDETIRFMRGKLNRSSSDATCATNSWTRGADEQDGNEAAEVMNAKSVVLASGEDARSRGYNDYYTRIFSEVADWARRLNPFLKISSFTPLVFRQIFGATDVHVDQMFNFFIDDENERPFVFKNEVRVLSAILALNGDYGGGEFCFPAQNVKIKLDRGECVLFPPFWTHPHHVEAPKERSYRYTIHTWFHM